MPAVSRTRSGRRPGPSQTRDAIATAARAQFADVGYDRATFRRIAEAAGVDPALVVHFYGSKEELFREVMELPAAVTMAMVGIADGPRRQVGRRLAELIVGVLENPATRMVVLGRIRSATSHPHAAALVRETVTRDLGSLASALTDDEPMLRASLIGSRVVGIALARYVVVVEPLASMSPERLIELLAPDFQRCLAGPLAPDVS
jgi:AcrR family transcriptional regulator